MYPILPESWPHILADYKYLHAHPELSTQEFHTAHWLSQRLLSYGYDVHHITETGIAAVLVNGTGPVVAFRADIDGLAVKEETDVDWASHATGISTDGSPTPVMHACGHDIHMTSALHAARILAETRDE